MGIGQLLTMPLFFASNAIYPVSLMPEWLQLFARINPLTYLVDAVRGMMIVGGTSRYGTGFDLVLLSSIFLVLSFIAAKMYPTLAR